MLLSAIFNRACRAEIQFQWEFNTRAKETNEKKGRVWFRLIEYFRCPRILSECNIKQARKKSWNIKGTFHFSRHADCKRQNVGRSESTVFTLICWKDFFKKTYRVTVIMKLNQISYFPILPTQEILLKKKWEEKYFNNVERI